MKWLNDNVRHAALGNLTVQIVGAAGQLVFIPLYVQAWGGAAYGTWLICVGITAYAAILDFGVSQSASVKVIFALSNRDSESARFWAGLSMRVSAGMAALVLLGAAGLSPFALDFIEHKLGAGGYGAVLYACVALQLALLVVFNTFTCLIRAAGGNATASWISVVAIAGEVIVPPLIAVAGGSPSLAAFGLVASRLVGVIVAAICLAQSATWTLPPYPSKDYWSGAKSLIFPSIANLLLPGGVALFLQGTLAAIGSVLGAQAAAAFGIARTLSRLPFQLGYVLTRAELPNMTRAIALGERVKLRRILYRLVAVLSAITFPMLVIYGAFGGTFLEGWTRSNLQFQPSMITYLAIASAMHATWHLASAPLAATNRHGPFAIAYFLLVCISLYAVTQIRDVTDAALIVVCLDVVVAIIAGILLRFTDLERA